MTNLINPRNYDVGVIVGRFQVPFLHDGHKELIQTVNDRHQKLVIILGVSVTWNTVNNPLDFETRKQMVLEFAPNAIVLPIKDCGDDDVWSKKLDGIIRDVLSPIQTVVLYGSRDSFIQSYVGSLPTFELVQRGYQSGTEVRNSVRHSAVGSEDFRRGVIWASANRYPTVFTCVDVVIFTPNYKQIWLGGKNSDKGLWRLVGGFADIDSINFEQDAYREVYEETGMGITSKLQYVGSFTVDDWRYSKEPDCIRTLLFCGASTDQGRARDDIDRLQKFDVDLVCSQLDKLVVPEHRPLVQAALDTLTEKNENA